MVRKEGLLVEDALKLLAGQVEGDHVALVEAAVDDATEAGSGTELLQKGRSHHEGDREEIFGMRQRKALLESSRN